MIVGVNVQNTRPPIYEAGRGNHLQGLREGCRMAFQASKKNPQLIICVMGVSRCFRDRHIR